MIEIKINDKDCDLKADGTPQEMIAELCVATEILVNDICAGASTHLNKREIKELLIGAMISALSEHLADSPEGGVTQ